MKKNRIVSGVVGISIFSLFSGFVLPVAANADTASSSFTPNDPLFAEQWALDANHLNLESVWGTTTGQGQTIAILDGGITNHQDLGNIVSGYDMVSNAEFSGDGNGRDDSAEDTGIYILEGSGTCGYNLDKSRNSSWHGTAVASVAAATGNDNKGMIGVAPDASILPVRITDRCGGVNSQDVALGIRWAVGEDVNKYVSSFDDDISVNQNPATVINFSIFVANKNSPTEIEPCPPEVQTAINYATNIKNVPVVAAAGNDSASSSLGWPANCENVIVVASTDINGELSSYSSAGAVVDIVAPGGDMPNNSTPTYDGIRVAQNDSSSVPSAVESSSYTFSEGTSFAAPHVAGVVALMRSLDSTVNPTQIENTLKNYALSPVSGCGYNLCGAGIMNVKDSVEAMLPSAPEEILEFGNMDVYTYASEYNGNPYLSSLVMTDWDLDEQTLVEYQWERNGLPIFGQTSTSYDLTENDLYQNITVRVTASKPGYKTLVKSSEPYLHLEYIHS